jgi:hypothetical protein
MLYERDEYGQKVPPKFRAPLTGINHRVQSDRCRWAGRWVAPSTKQSSPPARAKSPVAVCGSILTLLARQRPGKQDCPYRRLETPWRPRSRHDAADVDQVHLAAFVFVGRVDANALGAVAQSRVRVDAPLAAVRRR